MGLNERKKSVRRADPEPSEDATQHGPDQPPEKDRSDSPELDLTDPYPLDPEPKDPEPSEDAAQYHPDLRQPGWEPRPPRVVDGSSHPLGNSLTPKYLLTAPTTPAHIYPMVASAAWLHRHYHQMNAGRGPFPEWMIEDPWRLFFRLGMSNELRSIYHGGLIRIFRLQHDGSPEKKALANAQLELFTECIYADNIWGRVHGPAFIPWLQAILEEARRDANGLIPMWDQQYLDARRGARGGREAAGEVAQEAGTKAPGMDNGQLAAREASEDGAATSMSAAHAGPATRHAALEGARAHEEPVTTSEVSGIRETLEVPEVAKPNVELYSGPQTRRRVGMQDLWLGL